MADKTGVSALSDLVIQKWRKTLRLWLDAESVKILNYKEISVSSRQALKLKNIKWRGLPKKKWLSMKSIADITRKYRSHITNLRGGVQSLMLYF